MIDMEPRETPVTLDTRMEQEVQRTFGPFIQFLKNGVPKKEIVACFTIGDHGNPQSEKDTVKHRRFAELMGVDALDVVDPETIEFGVNAVVVEGENGRHAVRCVYDLSQPPYNLPEGALFVNYFVPEAQLGYVTDAPPVDPS